MKTALLIACLFAAACPVAAIAQETLPPMAIATAEPWDSGFRPLPQRRVAMSVMARYEGRLVSAATVPPTPGESEKGAELIYEMRLLTPARTVLDIRIDARTGRFLEVSGPGLIEARRPGDGMRRARN